MDNGTITALTTAMDRMGRSLMRLQTGMGRPYQLKPLEARTLETLYRIEEQGENEITPSALSGEMEVHSPLLSPVLTALEQRGLLDRRGDEQDRRRVYVALTPAGREIANQFIGHREALIEHIAEYLGETDARELTRLVERISEFSVTQQQEIQAWKKGEKL